MKIKNGSIRHQTLYVMRYINFLLLFIYVCFKQWKPGINLPDIFLSDIQVPFEKDVMLPKLCCQVCVQLTSHMLFTFWMRGINYLKYRIKKIEQSRPFNTIEHSDA